MSAVKLGFLAIRTIAKPIANSIKSYSAKHPKFRDACISVAQFSHKTEMQLKMKFLGYKVESIRPLNDARAVEMGANFLGEAIIFGVAGSLIILENARTRMNARDRKNHVDDTLDNLLLITSELREELKELEVTSDKKIQDLQNENVVLKRTLNEILDVSLRLRNHTPYSGQEIGIGNTAGGFVLQIADEPMIRSFPADPVPPPPSPPSSPIVNNAPSSTASTPLQSSYDFHHEHHQLGHPQHQEDFILIDQTNGTSVPHHEQPKKSRWESLTFSWPSSGSSSGSSSTPSAA
ncbi:OPA3-domain-containing protein [Linnemannia elongata AG-77]|uniref:OPA3-domain-containing protein n=1 Tax=Linnemannia elongata AG-77 TaxID=1314771 RepID=A0A197KHS8_9FUNG|nr:OPA3-domain-containing protein [Linnemannia elongata AG-77]